MQTLLGPGGCPWDREQSFESLRPYVVEEAFEVVDAIDRGDMEGIREELGDLLFQVVFCAELARSAGHFGPDDVIQEIAQKMIRRHPHVFGDAKAHTPEEVVNRWEAIKAQEKRGRGALEGVPVALPALLRAVRIGEKASRVGYDWPDAAGARAKIDEELAEVDAAGDPQREFEELGDLLFAVASFARKRGHDPEAALRHALDRFTGRFERIEADARARGEDLSRLDADELERRWQAAKRAFVARR